MERRMASVAAYEHRGFERDGVDRRDERRQEVLDADHAAGVAAVDVESACTGDSSATASTAATKGGKKF